MTASAADGPRRRTTLRARLIGLVVAVAAAALIAVDVVIPVTVQSALMAGKEQTLVSVTRALGSFGSERPLTQQLDMASSQSPLGGQVGWTIVQGNGKGQVAQPLASDPTANPAVGWSTPTDRVSVVRDVDKSERRYLALGLKTLLHIVELDEVIAVNVVAWVPLADVTATIQQLVLLEVLISAGLVVLVGAIAGFVVRRELRPLETMARTADEIAAGDVSRRVDPGSPGTEVGRLGTAFNGMVDGVSALLAERVRAEGRMRQFVADASHELRTPVAAVRGYTDLYLAGALSQDEALSRAMERMNFEARRMGTLVEDLLTLTHTDADGRVPDVHVDLVAVLAGAVDDAAVIDESRVWRLAGTDVRAVVRGDRLRLHQLFANLLANARTHTPPGTTVTVSVTADDEMVTVTVIDDGPGVDDDDLPHLFDRFYRADKARSRERGGSGLGLSIVAAIVRAHGGQVRADATDGGGLTITVFLPVVASGDGTGEDDQVIDAVVES